MTGLVRVSVSIEPPAPTVTTTIEPSTPIGVPESGQRFLGHEHDDYGPGLNTELEAEGGGDNIVVPGGFAPDNEDSLSILTAKTEACLDDGGKHQNARSLPPKLAR